MREVMEEGRDVRIPFIDLVPDMRQRTIIEKGAY
jgi:hypothetical protein